MDIKAMIIGAAIVFGIAGSVDAAEKGVFLGAEGGGSFVHNTVGLSFKPGYVAGLTGGYDFGAARIQGELTYRENAAKTHGNVSLTSLSANALYEFKNSTTITPFVGGGFGLGYIDFRNAASGGAYVDDGTVVETAQIIGGTGFKLAQKMYLDLSYRFLVSTFQYKQNGSGDDGHLRALLNHNVMVGIRWGL